MAQVRPFRGLRYTAQAGDLGDVISPPYDVVSPAEQQALHRRNPYNVLRVELAEGQEGDDERDNRYTRAAGLLRDWIAAGALRRDDRPTIYICRHDFKHAGRGYRRWELFVRLRLEPWDTRVVLPHEHTLPEPKADRMNLLRATTTNVSPVYCLVGDARGELAAIIDSVASGPPVAEVPAWRDEAFALWLAADPGAIARLEAFVSEERLYIADGHHRYETALAYRAERASAGGDAEAGFNYVFAALTRLEDPGLLVLPIHRLVRGVSEQQVEALRSGLAAEWQVESVPVGEAQHRHKRQEAATFLVYGLDAGRVLVASPRDEAALRARIPAALPEPLRRLDLSLLHTAMLHGYLGIGRDPREVETALGFTHDAGEAIEQVDAGRYLLAFLVNPTRVEELVAVAEAGEKMPQKSTFFYPKLPTGLVLNPLTDA